MRLVPVLLVVVLVGAAPATAEVRTVADVHTPDRAGRTAFPVIDAFGGRVVWSDYDATGGVWRLMENTGAVTRPVPVAGRSTPFDVDLGPDGHGSTRAVYSRCARRPPGDLPTPPLTSRRYGCDLYSYSFRTGREGKLERASTRADETWPTVWRSRLAFVRVYPDRKGRAGRDPHVYRRTGGGASQRVRLPSPVITVRDSAGTIMRERLPYAVDGLDLRGRTVAYVWLRGDDESDTASFVYTETAGGALRPAARGVPLGSGAGVNIRILSDVALTADSVEWLFVNIGEPQYFGSFMRARREVRRSATSKAVAFARDAGSVYWIDGGPGAERDATAQPGGTFRLLADSAVTYRAVPRGWLWVRPPG